MTYLERIKNEREDRDLSQTEIACILEVSPRTYSDYESGRIRLPIDRLVVLAKYYNLSIDYMCGASDIRTEFPKK